MSCHYLFIYYFFSRDKHVFVATKHVFCRGKSLIVATNTSTNICHDKNLFRDKHNIVATIDVFYRDKHVSVLSRQTRVDRTFVATNTCLSRQIFVRTKVFFATNINCTYTFIATKDVFCRDKHVFVATKLWSRRK